MYVYVLHVLSTSIPSPVSRYINTVSSIFQETQYLATFQYSQTTGSLVQSGVPIIDIASGNIFHCFSSYITDVLIQSSTVGLFLVRKVLSHKDNYKTNPLYRQK